MILDYNILQKIPWYKVFAFELKYNSLGKYIFYEEKYSFVLLNGMFFQNSPLPT